MNVRYAVLDESMSGWRPKTSVTGGLPNIMFEPRNPKNLGTMIHNSAECIMGMIVHHDIVQGWADQAKKKYVSDKSSLPKGEDIQVHVAEVLRQSETSIELMKIKGIHSTFIVKQNLNYCP